MPVHAQSVISTWINSFDPALYTAITDKENQVYTAGTNGGLTEFQPAFTQLNNALTTWKNTDRSSKIADLVTGLYSYKVMADMYGTSTSLLASSDSRAIFTMNGYRSRIKTDAITYYDDYPQVTFTTTTITRTVGSWITDGFTNGMSITVSGTTNNNIVGTVDGTPTALVLTVTGAFVAEGPIGFVTITGTGSVRMMSAKIKSDITLITNSFTTQELPALDNLINSYPVSTKGKIHDILFQSITPGTSLSKLQMAQYIFTTLNYAEVYNNLNVGSLTVPPLV